MRKPKSNEKNGRTFPTVLPRILPAAFGSSWRSSTGKTNRKSAIWILGRRRIRDDRRGTPRASRTTPGRGRRCRCREAACRAACKTASHCRSRIAVERNPLSVKVHGYGVRAGRSRQTALVPDECVVVPALAVAGKHGVIPDAGCRTEAPKSIFAIAERGRRRRRTGRRRRACPCRNPSGGASGPGPRAGPGRCRCSFSAPA